MNEDIFVGKWQQFKGKVKEKWGKLTDDDLTMINGKREKLLGRLRERYGWETKRAEEELNRFEHTLNSSNSNENAAKRHENIKDYEKKGKRDEDFPRKRKAG